MSQVWRSMVCDAAVRHLTGQEGGSRVDSGSAPFVGRRMTKPYVRPLAGAPPPMHGRSAAVAAAGHADARQVERTCGPSC